MLILTLRTDKPESEIGLYENDQQLAYETWHAHRQLAETLHAKIKQLLESQDKDWHDLQGVVAYQGPGSFTGLRIGLSVVNALGGSLQIPVKGSSGDDWLSDGLAVLLKGDADSAVLPEYGGEIFVTAPKK